MPTQTQTDKATARTPYPDIELIKRLRSKFVGEGFKSLTSDEAIDLINHLNEYRCDAERLLLVHDKVADSLNALIIVCSRKGLNPNETRVFIKAKDNAQFLREQKARGE